MSESESESEYETYDLDVSELKELLYIYPETICKYYIYEIKFYSILKNIDEDIERQKLLHDLVLNYKRNSFCTYIGLGFVLNSVKQDDLLIVIKNTITNNYVGIISCKDMYPKNEFVLNLLCSTSKDSYDLNYSFGLLLQHIMINFIYDNYEKDNENDDIFSIYLNSVESAHKYYLNLGYEYGKSCSNKNEYLYSDDEFGLYPMKLCNLRKTLHIIYDKILIKLKESWEKLPLLELESKSTSESK
jgi:hypothetical protein